VECGAISSVLSLGQSWAISSEAARKDLLRKAKFRKDLNNTHGHEIGY
jgi:hypothetical protein